MSNTIITIARCYGSGGRRIGKLLAERMNYAYYDRNLIYLASSKSGVDVRVFSHYDESVRPTFLEKLSALVTVPPESRKFTSRESIFRYQSQIIRELASDGDSVFIGRCANHTLRDCGHRLIRVFIWAPHEVCVKNIMDKFSISEEEADKTVTDINRHRSEYFKFYTGTEWDSARNYDLCINTAETSEADAVELLKRYIGIFPKL